MTARLLMIGLDGADGDLLDRLSADGFLPHLAGLRARGYGRMLSSARAATDDALWASFQYGADVGEHGRYGSIKEYAPGQRRAAIIDERNRQTFWDVLSEAGLRVAIIDVPKCRPPRPLNGIHLLDWLVHGRYFPVFPLSYPELLAHDVILAFGEAPPSNCGYRKPAMNDDEVRIVRDNLFRSVEQKRKAGRHFLTSENWDLFVIGFKEAHCGCHGFWEFADPAHAKHDAARVARLGNPVHDVLKAQDDAIGELIAAAGPEATIIVFSSSNFIPNGSIVHLVPGIVDRINRYLAATDAAPSGSPPLCRIVPYSDNAAALRLAILADEDAAQHRRRLDLVAALVAELTDIDDGLPVIPAVTRPASEHAGMCAESLPHLVLLFRENNCARAATSPRLGRIEATPPDNIRSGNHAPGGFVIAAGPADIATKDIGSLKDFAGFAAKIFSLREPARHA